MANIIANCIEIINSNLSVNLSDFVDIYFDCGCWVIVVAKEDGSRFEMVEGTDFRII